MKPTKHATTNYRMIRPFLDVVDASPEQSRRFLSGSYMPLCVEYLGYTFHGGKVYSIAHYGTQNGDLMRDPDMTISVDHKAGTIDPLTWQNDYMGSYSEVYDTDDNGREVYRPRLRSDLNRFLWQWLKNIQEQKFSPDVYQRDEDEETDTQPATAQQDPTPAPQEEDPAPAPEEQAAPAAPEDIATEDAAGIDGFPQYAIPGA